MKPVQFSCQTCSRLIHAEPGTECHCGNCGRINHAPQDVGSSLPPERSPPVPAIQSGLGPIIFLCPNCSRRYKAPRELIGKKGNCRDCGAEIVVPEVSDKCKAPPAKETESSTEQTLSGV